MLTGDENLRMMARLLHLRPREAAARSAELLAEFGLEDARDRRVKTYSGGMRRRLDLAISMIVRPALLFLDEPTTGLDPRSREQLWGTVRKLADEGVTVLLTTQYLAEADVLADRIAMLDHGRIVAEGSADELKSSLRGEVVRLQFADPGDYKRALREVDAHRRRRAAAHRRGRHRRLRRLRLPAARPAPGRGRARGAGVGRPPQPRRRVPVPDRHQPHRRERKRPMSTAAYALSDTSVMITRCMRRSLRDPEAFFTALMLPIILMLLFVYIFGGDLNTGGRYVNYVVPGLIVLCAGFGAGTTAVVVATDMSSGIVDRFRSMPIHASSVLAGHIVASLARNLLATALVIGVGLGVGWRPTDSPVRWLGAVAMIVAFILAMSWLAAAFGLLVRSPEAATGATFVLMFIPYLSTAFVPARTLPAVLRPIAANQPFTPVIETMRGLWMGRTSTGASVGHEALLAGLYCAAILVISFVCASRLYTRRTAA